MKEILQLFNCVVEEIILSWSFILVATEDFLNTPVTFSALIAIMFIGVALQKYRGEVSIRLSAKYNKLWVAAEVFLFVLVGATVNIYYLGNVGIKAFIVIVGALVLRMMGVFVCLLGTELNTWRNSIKPWLWLRRCHIDGSCSCHCINSPAWSVCN